MGWYVGGGIAAIFLLIFVAALICFFKVFYLPKYKPMGMDEYDIPEGEIYEPYREQLTSWMDEIRRMEREPVEIISFDGLTLRGM